MATERHLSVVREHTHPQALAEYAGDDVSRGLETKLGSDALWLVAQEGYGIVVAGADEADCLEGMGSTHIPVTYVGLRQLRKVEHVDEYRQCVVELTPPVDPVAVFAINDEHPYNEWGSGDAHEVLDYAEVAVIVTQPIQLLDDDEYPREEVLPMRRRPQLVVDNTRS